ncbi:MAG: LNR domain-containing protein [Pseudomonadota bacterium]
MYTRAIHKEFRLFILIGFVVVSSSYATLVFSSGFATILQQKNTSYSDIQWPVVRNGDRELLGIFGGLSPAYNQVGVQESAILVILQSGYIVPVLENGDVATFPVVYYLDEHCKGREYFPVSEPMPGSLPVRGMMYRSAVSKTLVYIPRYEESAGILARSRLFLNRSGKTECEKSTSRLRVLEAVPHSPEITGVYDDGMFHLASVDVDSLRGKSQTREIPSNDESLSTSGDADYPDAADPSLEECSPGCLLNAIGNGSCDTECYVEACYYDQGDCDSVNSAKLQQMLSDMCSPGCFSADIGDSFCDSACNTQACQFDNGDCKQQ